MKAIVRKELADHFSSVRFPLICALIFMAALSGAYLAGDGIRQWLSEGLGNLLAGRAFLALYSVPGAFVPVFALIGYLGPLIGLLLGFDAINRERQQGTLAKILAQPVYRDEVIAGKFLAGLFTLAVMSAALLLLIAGLGLAVVGLVPTPGEAARLAVFWLLSLIYLGFWLALALFMSIICRSVAASALASGAAWIFLAFFVAVLAGGLAGAVTPAADPLKPSRDELLARESLVRRLSLVSPVNLYHEAAGFLLDPSRRTLHQGRQMTDKALANRYTGRFSGPLELSQSLILVMPHLAVLLALSAAAFWLSYLVFIRQEIRT